MNTFLWILQAILCIKFISVAYAHGLRQDKPVMHESMARFGQAARPLLRLVAAVLFLCALGVVLPALVGSLAWTTPLSAAVLALAMLVSIPLHIKAREKPLILADIVLFALAGFVAYGRWILAPI
jgi:hypothetical protein